MLKRIKTTDLCVGMYIKELCGSWMDHPFLRGRFLLSSEQDLKQILNSSVSQVWIDTDKGLDIPPGALSLSPEEAAQQADERLEDIAEKTVVIRSSMEDELASARRICERSKAAVVEMFSHARMGAVIDLDDVDTVVDDIAHSIHRHPNALISLARLKTADEYTYLHSVAVCALMIALARQLGLSEALVHEAGIAGLLHDIGKASVPDAILNKPGKLDNAEFELIRRHPQAGGEILVLCHHVSALAVDVCLHHHEKIDGSGYPSNLKGEQLSLFARMGAVCDVYDAITSDRPYKKGWGPAESIHKMAEWQGHFDENVFKAFVRTVGIYPVGSLVRLESGALGVVTEQHERSLLTPKVKVFFMTKGRTPILPRIVDLAKVCGADRIVGRESPEAWGFRHLDELWKGAL
ncbi:MULTISPECIES: HD-GYP domain-containing protein [Pseudomonas]|uniref:Putative domain HDIG-containing protein n=1 Tax=Pseudomonas asplenii TaxID=53407 RepID=A0A0N0E1D5_9PSED|nr:HD-GYP domain-containing protein [Pseudomonas fuscovaginae]KPA87574.1 putative domain HDIG-containing protein [Pseudomonas fuscovaginae]KPA94308.1 HDIG-domain-containing protein [Pseudomonas fuscovaginae]